MIEGIRLGNIMIDCNDDDSLREFYHKLLGWEKITMYGCPAVQKDGVVFLFNKEEGYLPPVWPEENGKQQKQMHFDFQVENIVEAAEYAVTLGATKSLLQYGEDRWITLFDPEGHPFCLCASSNEA